MSIIRLDKFSLQTALDIPPKSTLLTISQVINRESNTYAAGGEEKVKLNVEAVYGLAIIIHEGDGDSAVKTRIYVDGTLQEQLSGNSFTILFAAFTNSLKIALYGDNVTGYNSTIKIAGVRRGL